MLEETVVGCPCFILRLEVYQRAALDRYRSTYMKG